MAERRAMFRGPAELYDRFVGRYSSQLARAMCKAVAVRPGQRVLDVGCGSGALTALLADVLGADHVTGIDPSEPFVDAARARAPGASILVGSAESLPFAEGEFDTTLSQLVVNFLDDPAKGLAEMRRVTRPGGVVAGCVWDYSGEMTLLGAFWEAASALDPHGACSVDERTTMKFATPDELERLWVGTGFHQVAVSAIVAEASYEDFDDLWSPFPTGVGPAGAYTASLGEEDRSVLRGEFRRRLGDPAGPFVLSARAWCAIGHVPQS